MKTNYFSSEFGLAQVLLNEVHALVSTLSGAWPTQAAKPIDVASGIEVIDFNRRQRGLWLRCCRSKHPAARFPWRRQTHLGEELLCPATSRLSRVLATTETPRHRSSFRPHRLCIRDAATKLSRYEWQTVIGKIASGVC
jgi:hypothetical protein